MGVLGLFNVWMSGVADREDMVIGSWVVLGMIEEGHSRQVLHHPDGVRRKRKGVKFEVGAWCEEVCGITKWDPVSPKWEGELVRFQCAPDRGGCRFKVHLNWTPVCWSSCRYENAAWSAMCVPESASRADFVLERFVGQHPRG